jgi:hypothetical protein
MAESGPLIIMDPLAIILILAVPAAILLWLRDLIMSPFQKRAAARSTAQLESEARSFVAYLKARSSLPTLRVSIMLEKGESGILEEPSELHEAKTRRVYSGVGTDINGLFVGGGASESYKEIDEVDAGNLVLTNKRLVFTGRMETRILDFGDILAVRHAPDAFEVSSKRRDKSQFYKVRNPILWAETILVVVNRFRGQP